MTVGGVGEITSSPPNQRYGVLTWAHRNERDGYGHQMDENYRFSGSVLVTRGPDVVLRMSTGKANAETGAPCSPETRFQIASVSKQFTAAAAMLLVEDGALDVDVPIADWLPDCPPRWCQVTLGQLLSHTSGLDHWLGLPGFEVSMLRDADDFLERFAAVPLRGVPGTTWHYSSPGYVLIARIIEQVSGLPYRDFLTANVLRPGGLENTEVGSPSPGAVAHGYRGDRRVDVTEFAALPGAGDLWSTVDDLARYTAIYDAGQVVAASSRTTMVAPHALVTPELAVDSPITADSYGYGYYLGTLAGQPAHFHPGDNPGYQSFLGHLPGTGATVAILSNSEDTDLAGLLRYVLAVATGRGAG